MFKRRKSPHAGMSFVIEERQDTIGLGGGECLFPSACYASYVNYNMFIYTEHLRVHKNSLKRIRVFQIELEFESVGF